MEESASYENYNVATKRKSISGTDIRGENFYEEYLATLRGAKGYAIYDQMRRSDYKVQQALRVLYTPILSAKFEFVPKDENDEEQRKQVLYKNNYYKKYPVKNWNSILTEVLGMLPFGFSMFEPYQHVVDDPELGKIWTLKDMGYIKQKTIQKWNIKEAEIEKIRQLYYGDETIDKWIDGESLICFTNQQEGDNFEGISVIRSAYGCYIRKDLYLKLDMIGAEKMSVGTPIFYVPKGMINNPVEKAYIESIGQAYAGHQKAYILLPDELKDGGFDIKEGKYNSVAIAKSIRREDTAILDLILASFLEIGTGKSGGNAQNDGQMQLFLNSLLATAEYIADKLSDKAHKDYVFNFGEPEVRCDQKVSGIAKDDAKTAMEIIRGYLQTGAIRADDTLEVRLRKDLELPNKDKATERVLSQTVSDDDKDEEEGKPQEKPENDPSSAE